MSIGSANKGLYPPGFERALLQFKTSRSDTTFRLLERIPTLVSQRPTVVSKVLIPRYGNVQSSGQMLGQRLLSTDHDRVSNLNHEVVDATCCLLRESEASTVVLRREKTQATGYPKQGGGR
jgi:hypothetical protein